MKLTKEQLAARLNGREISEELSREESKEANRAGLFVIFGYSDDILSINGVQNDEFYCCGGGEFQINSNGIILIDEEEKDVLDRFGFLKTIMGTSKTLFALWDKGDIAWTYKIDCPHATFDIMEDGEVFCRGIVIDREDLL